VYKTSSLANGVVDVDDAYHSNCAPSTNPLILVSKSAIVPVPQISITEDWICGKKGTTVTSTGILCESHTLTYVATRSEEHTSELQSRENLVCRLLLEKKNGLKGGTRS